MLMRNGDVDLQAPLESARRVKKNWPNSAFLTINHARHVTIATNRCTVRAPASFLEQPVLPKPGTCGGSRG
jgi:TAP-like protein